MLYLSKQATLVMIAAQFDVIILVGVAWHGSAIKIAFLILADTVVVARLFLCYERSSGLCEDCCSLHTLRSEREGLDLLVSESIKLLIYLW